MGAWCGQVGLSGWAGMAAFWLVMVTVAIWGVTRLFPLQRGGGAREALDGRLARGEIDAETYRLVRRELDDLEPATREGR